MAQSAPSAASRRSSSKSLPSPISLVGPVVGMWFTLGVIFLIVLATRSPDRLRATAKVFGDEPATRAGTVTPV